jgi:hypothetical protein
MADRYGFVTLAQLGAADDPVEVLIDADTLPALLALTSFDPDNTGFWARAKIQPTSQTVDIRNAKTGLAAPATACALAS